MVHAGPDPSGRPAACCHDHFDHCNWYQPNEKRRPMGGDYRLVAGIGFAVVSNDTKTIRTAKK